MPPKKREPKAANPKKITQHIDTTRLQALQQYQSFYEGETDLSRLIRLKLNVMEGDISRVRAASGDAYNKINMKFNEFHAALVAKEESHSKEINRLNRKINALSKQIEGLTNGKKQ